MTPNPDILTDFDAWIVATYAETQGFTMLIVLLGIRGNKVDLLRSAHLHLIGDELRWPELAAHLDGAGIAWDAVALYRAGREGLISDDIARDRLAELTAALRGDRTLIRHAEFFNRDGLALRLDDADPAPPRLN